MLIVAKNGIITNQIENTWHQTLFYNTQVNQYAHPNPLLHQVIDEASDKPKGGKRESTIGPLRVRYDPE